MKLKYRPIPTRLVFQDSHYKHVFGGPPKHTGTIPKDSAVSLHHVLSLDLADPFVPFESDNNLSIVPLYYPLLYGFGGGEAQYKVISDTEIELLYVCDSDKPDTDEDYPYMDEFPQRSFSLKQFSYEEFRAFLISEQAPCYDESAEDKRLLNGLTRGLVQIGGPIFPIQGAIKWECRNSECKWHQKPATLRVFARVATAIQDMTPMFGELSDDVEIYFGLCKMCKTIVTVNRCT